MTTLRQRAGQVGVSATVTRANGTIEEYGLVGYHCRNPLRRWIVWRLMRRGDRLPKEQTMRASTLALARRLIGG